MTSHMFYQSVIPHEMRFNALVRRARKRSKRDRIWFDTPPRCTRVLDGVASVFADGLWSSLVKLPTCNFLQTVIFCCSQSGCKGLNMIESLLCHSVWQGAYPYIRVYMRVCVPSWVGLEWLVDNKHNTTHHVAQLDLLCKLGWVMTYCSFPPLP